jgi:hypothetical protein
VQWQPSSALPKVARDVDEQFTNTREQSEQLLRVRDQRRRRRFLHRLAAATFEQMLRSRRALADQGYSESLKFAPRRAPPKWP